MAVMTNGLRAAVLGSVLVEGDEGYDRERSAWNLTHRSRPAVIVVPSTPRDIVAAVDYVREHDLPVAVQSTGHGQTVPADGGVLINTRQMTGISVDKDERTVRIHPGVQWQAVVDATAEHGLSPLIGSSITVGAVGYITGGGLPVLGRKFGYAADHVRALDLVTPDGRYRRVTPDQEPDLFWAVRGGGCNFGVVTAVEIDLMSLPELYGGQLVFPGEMAAEVLPTWVEWCRDLPDEMCSSLLLMRVPDAPAFPPEVRGKFLIFVRIGYTGPRVQGEHLIASLRALRPMMSSVDDLPIGRLSEIHADPTEPLPVVERAFRTKDLDIQAVDQVVEVAGPRAENPPTLFEIRHMGGALGRPPTVPNAIGRRDAPFTVSMPTIGADAAQVERAHQAHNTVVEALQPWRAGGSHLNFISPSGVAAGEVGESYDPADYVRLRQIKREWDPGNLFRLNRNIPPADGEQD